MGESIRREILMEYGICDDPSREKYVREVLGGKIGP